MHKTMKRGGDVNLFSHFSYKVAANEEILRKNFYKKNERGSERLYELVKTLAYTTVKKGMTGYNVLPYQTSFANRSRHPTTLDPTAASNDVGEIKASRKQRKLSDTA